MKKVFLLFMPVVALFGAGCMPATNVPTTSSTAAPTPNVVPTATSTTAAPPAGWTRFSKTDDPTSAFQFDYPSSANILPSALTQPDDALALDLGATVSASSSVKSVPTTQLHVKVLQPTDPGLKHCFYSAHGWATSTGSIPEWGGQHMTINGQDVCLYPESDSVASSTEYRYAYTFPSGGQEVVFDFVVHAEDCTNYDHPETDCVGFDEGRDTANFLPIITTFQGQPSAVGPLRFSDQTVTVSSTEAQINVVYPHLVGIPSADAFNALIDQRVLGAVNKFKDLVSSGAQDATDTLPWSYDMNYEISYRDDHRFTVLLSGGEYAGGAHPNEDYIAISYDTNLNKEITMADLFDPKANYLKEVSAASVADLEKQNVADEFSDNDWITTGAGPDAQNFAIFYLTEKTLGIIFPPYQVASYASGPQGVEIPYAKLSGILP